MQTLIMFSNFFDKLRERDSSDIVIRTKIKLLNVSKEYAILKLALDYSIIA